MAFVDSYYRKNDQGMTLIEVLAALILLSFFAVILLGIFAPAANWINMARKQTTASNYASAVLEDLRSNRGALLSDVTYQKPSALLLNETEYKPSDCPTMQAYITIRSLKELTSIINITVTVEWTEGGQTHSLELMTLMRTMGVT